MKRVFYDPKNPLCKKVIQKIKQLDKKRTLTISSLDGKKAKTVFAGNYAFLRKKKNLIVFLEGQRVWIKANAACRLLWLMGGPWKALGIFAYCPGFLINPIFRLCRLFVWR